MSQRLEALDAVRGTALVGIVLANVLWFSGFAVASPSARAALETPVLDSMTEVAIHIFVDGKFYGLFSLLFGASFCLLLRSAQRSGATVAYVVRRRLFALFLVGSTHAVLVWFGDIVSLYAVAAVPLYFVRSWPRRRLVRLGLACLAAPFAVRVVLLVLQDGVTATHNPAHAHGPGELIGLFRSGSYPQTLTANWAFLQERWMRALYSGRLPRLLGLFVLGFALVRDGIPQIRRPPPWLWLAALALNAALVGFTNVPLRPVTEIGLLRDSIYGVAIPLGSLLYAAWTWRWASRSGPVVRAVAATGRLSFTHYVVQSLIFSAVFYGWGWGTWGTWGAAKAAIFALVVVAFQIAVSRVYLRHFRRGPLEALVRRI